MKVVQYSYLGRKMFVTADYTEPGVKWTMANLAGTTDPDTGDIYSGFDRFGRVKDNRWYNYGSSTDVDRTKHGYDRMGNRLYRQNTVATANGAAFDELYSYDEMNRLHEMQRGTLNGSLSAILSPVFTECWSMDNTANWSGYRSGIDHSSWDLNQQRNINKVNDIVSFSNSVGAAWATPAYDPAGNMITFPKATDPTAAQTAVYDAWDRLMEVSEDEELVVQYQYDGVNRRTFQWSYTSGSLSETREFYYTTPRQWQVIEERVNSASTPERQFVWGLRYVDDVVLRDRDTDDDGSLDERLYALQDDNWNVTAIIDSTSAVQERYAYSAFGVPIFLSPLFEQLSISGFDWDRTYCGYIWNQAICFFHVRNRVLHPTLGTWLQRDPLGYVDGMNLYAAYRPLISTDPYGMYSLLTAAAEYCRGECNPGKSNSLYDQYGPDCVNKCYQSVLADPNKNYSVWFNLESKDTSWADDLPGCPCNLRKVTVTHTRCVLGPFAAYGSPTVQTITYTTTEFVNDDTDFGPPSVLFDPQYHPGATYEIRSAPNKYGASQQCTYDSNGNLIESGVGAGTADRSSSSNRTGGIPLDHIRNDVSPWLLAKQLCEKDPSERGKSLADCSYMQQYFKVRPIPKSKVPCK